MMEVRLVGYASLHPPYSLLSDSVSSARTCSYLDK